jgi:putative endonuclease
VVEGGWYVYILRCYYDRGGESEFNLYTGSTTDVERRLEEHRDWRGGRCAKCTRAYKGRVELVYFEEHPGRSEAQSREHEIKSLSRSEKEKLIASGPGARVG